MKGYSAFPKAPALLKPHYQIVQCHMQYIHIYLGESYPSAEMQLVHSTAPADLVKISQRGTLIQVIWETMTPGKNYGIKHI